MTGIGTLRVPLRLTTRVRPTLAVEERLVRTARVGPAAVVAGAVEGAEAGTAGARSVGTVTCGKRAAGNDSSGIAARAGVASNSERIASAISTA